LAVSTGTYEAGPEIRDTEAKIRVAYGNLMRKREIEGEIAKYTLETTSLTGQLTNLQKGLKGLSEADQELIKQKALYDNEELIVENLKNAMTQAEVLADDLKSQFDDKAAETDKNIEVHNKALLKGIRSKYAAKLAEIKKTIDALADLYKPASLKDINDELKTWESLKKDFDKKYESAKAKATVNQEQLKQIGVVEKRIAELNKLQRTSRNALAALDDPETGYKTLRKKWNALHVQKVEALDKQCQQFSALSVGLIKADVKNSLDIEALKESFKTAFASLNIRKVDDLCTHLLGAADPVAAWNTILAELEQLALHNAAGADPLPATPTLDACGLALSEKQRVAKGLDPTKWLELSVTPLEFNPIFQYCANKDTNEYIAFADASAGQQATALLTVLLNQQGAPLIIDQPEDDVDSKMSPEIVEQIWRAKSRRQLIFTSHNANFVVNGDAELVICCDYVRAGDQTGGQIKAEGAIDNATIRDEITTVTEGGRQAFKLRMDKYGF
jgi:type III restriction enzyme